MLERRLCFLVIQTGALLNEQIERERVTYISLVVCDCVIDIDGGTFKKKRIKGWHPRTSLLSNFNS